MQKALHIAEPANDVLRDHVVRLPVFSANKRLLSAKELEVLRLVSDGLTTKEIAAELGITFKTAACHRSRILQKLGMKSTVTAVRWAIREGIVSA
jgi:DNA-binding NarL/FixJ family response regulator